MVDVATPQDIADYQRSQERNLFNPYRARRSGQAATLGHLIGDVSPAARDAVLHSTGQLHNLLDSADISAGSLLNKAGVPASWTLSEENVNLGKLPHGKSGIYPTKRIYMHRASVPIGRAASIAALASLGLWAKNKLLNSPEESTETPMTRTASPADLTTSNDANTVDAQKLASHVIEKQAALISELHTEHHRVAKYAAALAQAVQLAEDGAIDVSDIKDHARQLIASGSVKLSAADDVFDQSPGELQGPVVKGSGERLDPLTKLLRSLPS